MRTLTSITAIIYSPKSGTETTHHFWRSFRAKIPTFLGAARMIATRYNAERFDESIPKIKSSDVSVIRIQYCDIA